MRIDRSNGPELTILMPCLNEAETIGGCIREAREFVTRTGIAAEIVIADNGSTDGSQQIALAAGARVIDVTARGYGAALIGGIRAAYGEYVIFGDADGSYDFAHLDAFVAELRRGADLVMGNRFRGGIAPRAMPALHRYVGNPVLSWIGRLFYGPAVHDFHCGLRGVRRDAALAMDLRTTGMEFASEIVVKSHLCGYRVVEVPTVLRPDGRSRPPHLRTWIDGWRHLRFLLLYSPRWLFFYPGVVVALAGLVGMVLLGSGAWSPGRGRFSEGLLVASCGLLIAGVQALQVALLARAYAVRRGLLPHDRLFRRLNDALTLEIELIAAGVLVIGSASMLVVSLYIAPSSLPSALKPTVAFRLGALAVTLGVIGFQLALTAWLQSLLQIADVGSSATESVAEGADRVA